MVDTKSANQTTLLHFLERTVAKHFPDMESFLDELATPADAYRGLLGCPFFWQIACLKLLQSIFKRLERA
jgi:cytokinesis protein